MLPYPNGRGHRLRTGSVRVQIPPGVLLLTQQNHASVAELVYAAGSEPATDKVHSCGFDSHQRYLSISADMQTGEAGGP